MNTQIKQQGHTLIRLAIVLVCLFMILIYAIPGLAKKPTSGVEVPGDTTCEDLTPYVLASTFMVSAPMNGWFDTPSGYSIFINTEAGAGVYFDWSTVTPTYAISMDAVLVRSGPSLDLSAPVNLYLYDPELDEDTGLHAPINPETRTPYPIGSITFCDGITLMPTETGGIGEYIETLRWGLEAIVATQTGGLVLSPGQVFSVDYTVDLWVESAVKSDFAASGDIVIENPTETDAIVESVVNTVGGIVSEVECEAPSFPYILPPDGELLCFYRTALPDDSTRISLTEVIMSGDVGNGFGAAVVDFASAEVFPVGDCVELQGVVAGAVVTYCGEASPISQPFTRVVGPYSEEECGAHEVTHTISFVTTDDSDWGSASWVVSIDVPCETGCTLTPGYWKTHSIYGPAPYDDTWNLVDEDSPFFDTGHSWFEVLWIPSKGTTFYKLAHAYGAAYLNGLNGADQSDVLDAAESLLRQYDEAMSQIKGQVRREFVSVAQELDDYNNGLIGPGSCSE